MRLILESTGGPSGAKRVVVRNGEKVKFGRTDAADFAFPRDNTMSGQHFQIAVVPEGCFLTDLGSTNGTTFRGSRLAPQQPAPLKDGDTFVAGESEFQVRLEAELSDRQGFAGAVHDPEFVWPSQNPSAAASSPPAASASEQALAANASRYETWRLVPLDNVHFTAENCNSGLTLCRGAVAALSAADLAVRLMAAFPVTLIIDFQHLGSPPPVELSSPNYVMNWLDPLAAATVSPVVVGPTEVPGWAELVEEGWGQNAVICLFSQKGPTDELEHIRRCCKQSDGGVVGYCWPKVLGTLLAHSREMAEPFMDGLEAVLIEAADSPDSWQLYGKPDVAVLLEALGLIHDSGQPPVVGP